jgi:hypothetical protein
MHVPFDVSNAPSGSILLVFLAAPVTFPARQHIVTGLTGLIRNDGALKAAPHPIRAVEGHRESVRPEAPLLCLHPATGLSSGEALINGGFLRIGQENPTSGE